MLNDLLKNLDNFYFDKRDNKASDSIDENV